MTPRPERFLGRNLSNPSLADPVLSRRAILRGALLGAGVLATGTGLAGCATPSAIGAPADAIQLWDLFSGADGAVMRQLVAEIQREDPSIDVSPVTLAWGSPYYTKLAMASSGGRPPETAVMHLSRLAGYAPGGLLEPFDLAELERVGIHESDFPAQVWQGCQYDGQLFAVPFDTHPFVTFFNADVADQAGLLDSSGTMSGLDSPEAFLDAGRRLGAVTGSPGIAFGYVLDSSQAWRIFWGLYGQTGGEFAFEPGKPAEIDMDKARDVVSFLTTMMDGEIASSQLDYGGAIANFASNRAGLIFSGEWELPAFAAAIPNLGAMPVPAIFGQPASYADSHSYVLPSQATPDPAKRAKTYDFLGALLAKGATWAQGGHIPAFGPARESEEYQELTPQRDYAAAADNVVLDPPVWFAGAGTDFQNRMCQALSPAFQGQRSAEDAVTSMLADIDLLLSKPNPTA